MCVLFRLMCSLEKGQVAQAPPGGALLLAASLYQAWQGCEGNIQKFRAALNSLRCETDARYGQVKMQKSLSFVLLQSGIHFYAEYIADF